MERNEEELRERAKAVTDVVEATRLALQAAPVLGTAYTGRAIMGGMTVYEIRLKIEDMGLIFSEQEIARVAEELVGRGEAKLVHTENSVPSYQWWPPASDEAA